MSISKPGVPAAFRRLSLCLCRWRLPETQLGGEIQNVSVLVAIGVSQDGFREILGSAEGMKEDRESWHSFFVWLKERGLTGVRLIIGGKNLGMLETITEFIPKIRYQRYTVHFYRNIFLLHLETR